MSSLAALSAGMDRGGRLRSEWIGAADGRWALGRVHLGVLHPDPQLAAACGVHVALHGDIWNARELRRAAGLEDSAPLVEAVRRLWVREGSQGLSRLEGAFVLALLDTGTEQLVVLNDPLGTYPLYWSKLADGVVFAGELRALLRALGGAPALDPAAVGQYLAFGFPIGETTLARDVALMPAGSVFVYDARRNEATITRRSGLDRLFKEPTGSREEYVQSVGAALDDAVARVFDGRVVGMSLSGGLDSRLVLSAVTPARRAELTTYTLGVKGCADEIIADTLARIAGTRHRFFELSDAYLADFLPNLQRMVSLTDGMYLTHGLTEMLVLRFIDELGLDVLVRGHGGELLKTSLAWPWHTDARVHAMRSADEFVPYFLARVNYISANVPLDELFAPGWAAAVKGTAEAALRRSIDGLTLAPSDLCAYLYVAELHRRFTTASLELFRNHVEVRTPFVDPALLAALFRGPGDWREDTSLHIALTRQRAPQLVRVRNSNTGAPGDAGKLAEAIYERLNGLLRRLNVRGYRHYHSFDRWMRERLLESVEDVLLSPESLGRGQLREQTMRRLLEETRRGTRDHAYLFQVLLILELWQREQGV